MKITNIEEFKRVLNFAFSDEYENLKESEKNIIRNQIISAISEIDDAQNILIKKVKSYLIDLTSSGSIRETTIKNRMLFVFNMISENDKFSIISEYITNENNMRSYHCLDEDILIPMLDNLSDDLKIEALSKSDSVELFRFMGKLNELAKDRERLYLKNRRKYAKYYEICQKALAIK